MATHPQVPVLEAPVRQRIEWGVGWRCEQNFWDLGHMSHAMARAGEKKGTGLHWRERQLSKAKTPRGWERISGGRGLDGSLEELEGSFDSKVQCPVALSKCAPFVLRVVDF